MESWGAPVIENIEHSNQLLAIIIWSSFCKNGIHFFTPGESPQQLGYMNRPQGYKIAPHVHNSVRREVRWTSEVLFIKSGKVRVDFYDDNKSYLESRILAQGDIVLLQCGGHGFEMIEQSEIIEVKQGPYAGDSDKTRFEGITSDQATFGCMR
jgi:hypothetical protein